MFRKKKEMRDRRELIHSLAIFRFGLRTDPSCFLGTIARKQIQPRNVANVVNLTTLSNVVVATTSTTASPNFPPFSPTVSSTRTRSLQDFRVVRARSRLKEELEEISLERTVLLLPALVL
jgi:hypothetical protein